MHSLPFNTSFAYAQMLDEADPLADFRARFYQAAPGLIYLDGNSLGRLPLATLTRMEEVVQTEWGEQLIRSWGKNWFDAPAAIGDKIARLVGAGPGQVLVSDSTSVNLFKLSMAALALRPERSKIVSDALNFPSDLYILQGCRRLLGDRHQIHFLTSPDGVHMDTDEVCAAIDDQTALVSLSHVHFKSGYLYDAQMITAHCHRVGALVLWDLSHSAGVVPVELEHWEADFATGCTYKYLNGGPGAPAFLYVHPRLHAQVQSPIWGWFGQKTPFAFGLEYTPAPGIQRFLAGTPPVLSTLAMEGGVDLLLEAGLDRVRRKSIELTGYLIQLYDALLAPLGFHLGTPRDPARRGSHVSLRHPEGYRINQALIAEMDVIPDFREPDNIRLGLVPVYTSFREVWLAVERLLRVVTEERYQRYSPTRQSVT